MIFLLFEHQPTPIAGFHKIVGPNIDPNTIILTGTTFVKKPSLCWNPCLRTDSPEDLALRLHEAQAPEGWGFEQGQCLDSKVPILVDQYMPRL